MVYLKAQSWVHFFLLFLMNHISFLKLKFILVLFDTEISFAHSDIQKLKGTISNDHTCIEIPKKIRYLTVIINLRFDHHISF